MTRCALFQRFCVGIVVPEETLFRDWLKTNGFEKEADLPLDELCKSTKIRKAFLQEIRNFGTAHDLGNLQQVRIRITCLSPRRINRKTYRLNLCVSCAGISFIMNTGCSRIIYFLGDNSD